VNSISEIEKAIKGCDSLSLSTKGFAACILKFGLAGWFIQSLAYLAVCGRCCKRTAQRHLDALKLAGFLVVSPQYDPRRGSRSQLRNRYLFVLPAVYVPALKLVFYRMNDVLKARAAMLARRVKAIRGVDIDVYGETPKSINQASVETLSWPDENGVVYRLRSDNQFWSDDEWLARFKDCS
jgi:hypothetical protein